MRVVFLGRSRILWRQLVLQAVTLGIYRRRWLFAINKEVDGHEALGLNHRANAAMLWLAALGAVFLLGAGSLHLGVMGYVLGALCLAPTSILQLWTARRTAAMVAPSDVRYGNATAIWVATLVPILGGFFFIIWEQGRLNRFWSYERAHPGHGMEVDVELGSDPRFLVALDRARKESYYAGSRFERRKTERKARWTARLSWWSDLQAERKAVREAGGSTPFLPFLRPHRPRLMRLDVTCGRCATHFDLQRDPAAETAILCPKCGLAEVLPALWENPLAKPERAAVASVRARCPKCQTKFNAVRNLFGPTVLLCPNCGRREELPLEPGAKAARKPSRA
ncbi:MAG: hypothetical protein V4510_12265 [bacterium]